MKEIKFRLRDRHNKIVGYEKWYLGSYNSRGHYWTATPCWLYSEDGQHWNPTPIPHSQKDPYINFKGKNGKEAYAGDVVNAKRFADWHRGIIKWSESCVGWIIHCHWDNRIKADYYGVRFEELSELEIIGNQRENPELVSNPCLKEGGDGREGN